MKTKPIILTVILIQAGLCFGQGADEQAAFDKEWDQSARIANLYYPGSGVAETPIAKKILELDERMQAADAPLYYSPRKPFILCQIAATELGIKPTSPIPDNLMRVVSDAIADNSKSSKAKLPPVETNAKDGGKNEVIPEFNGYNNVTIRGIEPDGIRIIHESGAAKIPIERLTLAQGATFGLTAEGASEYRTKQAAAAAANHARQQSLRQERVQAEQPQSSTSSTVASDAEAKKAAFDAWIAQGGGLIDSSGSAPGSRLSPRRKPPGCSTWIARRWTAWGYPAWCSPQRRRSPTGSPTLRSSSSGILNIDLSPRLSHCRRGYLNKNMKKPDFRSIIPEFHASAWESWENGDASGILVLVGHENRGRLLMDNLWAFIGKGIFETALCDAYTHGPHLPLNQWRFLFQVADREKLAACGEPRDSSASKRR